MNASTLAAALESALNLYLHRDPENRSRSAALQGRVIAVELLGTGLTLYFLPDADGVQVLGGYEGEVDTRLKASPAGFMRLSLDNREDALFQGAVSIEGDTETGRQFQALMAASGWDWEESLSQFTGDIVAHQAGQLARRLGRGVSATGETLAGDCGEYLQEEARLLPARIEVEYFLNDVDHLRDDTERLQARVDRLLRTLAEQAP